MKLYIYNSSLFVLHSQLTYIRKCKDKGDRRVHTYIILMFIKTIDAKDNDMTMATKEEKKH